MRISFYLLAFPLSLSFNSYALEFNQAEKPASALLESPLMLQVMLGDLVNPCQQVFPLWPETVSQSLRVVSNFALNRAPISS